MLFRSSSTSIKQAGYEVRVAQNNATWGTDAFNADILYQPFVRDTAQFYRIKSKFIARGITYHGQIRLKDNLGNTSEWYRFRFSVNRAPFIIKANLEPQVISTQDDIKINLEKSASTIGYKVKWYRNGQYYNQFEIGRAHV